MRHRFLFQPGFWVGEGRIILNSSEVLHFYTRWEITIAAEGYLGCRQRVELRDEQSSVDNPFLVKLEDEKRFTIALQHCERGCLTGKGVIEPKVIAWEFHHGPDLEGFEVYELQEDGDYMLHAEYVTADMLRSVIDGRIWVKAAAVKPTAT